jgi:TfoX/Sxy family transcriptional regulator of competence genes
MPYDTGLAQRVRELLEEEPGFDEKKMFGGRCFLLFGNMICGIINNDLIIRIGVDVYEEALKLPWTKKFDLTGKPMKGWVMVLSPGLESDDNLSQWLQKAAICALPAAEIVLEIKKFGADFIANPAIRYVRLSFTGKTSESGKSL